MKKKHMAMMNPYWSNLLLKSFKYINHRIKTYISNTIAVELFLINNSWNVWWCINPSGTSRTSFTDLFFLLLADGLQSSCIICLLLKQVKNYFSKSFFRILVHVYLFLCLAKNCQANFRGFCILICIVSIGIISLFFFFVFVFCFFLDIDSIYEQVVVNEKRDNNSFWLVFTLATHTKCFLHSHIYTYVYIYLYVYICISDITWAMCHQN